MNLLGPILSAFFDDYLKVQRGLRPTSVRSYRDTLKLFLLFVAAQTQQSLTRLSLEALTSDRVLAFLRALEEERQNHIRTRNQRLAALRTFYRFVASRCPEMLVHAQRVEGMPTKRTPPPETHYLERDQIEALFSARAHLTAGEIRDRAVLLVLYNTGARVQEVVDLRVKDCDLHGPLRLRLHGKGDKWRVCPIWPDTAAVLLQLDTVQTGSPEAPLFVSRLKKPLTRFGIYKLVRRHTQTLHSTGSRTPHGRISPHVFRHTTAVHLLEAGVDVNVIRAWLGHVSLDTTNRYAEITIRMKQAAMNTCLPPVGASTASHQTKQWRQDQDLLKWLQAL